MLRILNVCHDAGAAIYLVTTELETGMNHLILQVCRFRLIPDPATSWTPACIPIPSQSTLLAAEGRGREGHSTKWKGLFLIPEVASGLPHPGKWVGVAAMDQDQWLTKADI